MKTVALILKNLAASVYAAREYDRLAMRSDAALARRGLRRDRLASHIGALPV